MANNPKFKRGFTWRHHLDEWWDRRPQEWKAKLFVGLVLGLFVAGIGLIYFSHRWIERDEILSEAKRIHQSRIEASDRLMAPKFDSRAAPELREGKGIQTRPGE